MEWLILFGLGSICYVIHKLIIGYFEYNHNEVTKTWKYILGWLIAISIFGSYFYYKTTTNIKDEGIYYVNLFEKVDSQKNYRVPGKIYANEDGYKLVEVYWSNGGQLTFYDSDSDLIIGEKVSIQDDEHKAWFVELTKDRVQVKK